MAPEIILDQGYSTSVDMWSLGCLIYEMATGYTLFHDENLNKLYEKILFQKIDLNRKECRHLSKELKNMLMHLLNRNPEERMKVEGMI